MKICLLNDSFPPVIDGVANVVINYAEHLREDHKAEIIVGTPRYPEADYSSYPYQVVPYQSFGTESLASGYRTGNPFHEKEVSALTDFGPDIIHTHCPASSTIIARLMRERTGAPIVFTYHTKYDIDLRRVLRVKAAAEESIRLMVSNIEACDDIWVVSKGAGESLKELGFQGDYLVMNNGVDFEKGRVCSEDVAKAVAGYDLPEDIPMFLFVGRIITYKNIPLILDALKILSASGRDFRMVFIGKGPDMELMQEKAREFGFMEDNDVPGKCIFTGPIYDRDVLRAWNTRADLFLFPSTFDTNGLVVREAAACGLASVLVADSCAAEGVTDGRNGFLIEESAESLAALLQRISGDLPHLHQVGENAMNEIYLSWKDAVSMAYDRYMVVDERRRAGKLAPRRHKVQDYMVKWTAQGMKEKARYRYMRKEIFDDFRETAVGMADNFHEGEARMDNLLRKLENTDIETVFDNFVEKGMSVLEKTYAMQNGLWLEKMDNGTVRAEEHRNEEKEQDRD